ncbi:MAG: VOC family protein [Gemmatimonadetes bacterium]|nr:VOC family protein [Gemmatimonadota bacterium]
MSAAPAGVGLDRIGQIAINAHDLERAVRFYRDTLGMRFLFQVPGMAFFDCGGIRLMLGLASEPRFDHPASILYYRVDDIHAAHQVLTGRGVAFERPPHFVAKLETHDLWLAFCKDSEDNVLALMAEVRR